MIKYLICLLILFAFTLNAQTIWYVDKDAGGGDDGTSWTDAWRSLNDIGWASISAGDTIYVSGGSSDSLFYTSNDVFSGTYYTFASGNPVIIAPAWHANHNGKVVFTNNGEAEQYMFTFMNVSNVKLTGFTFWDRRTQRGMSNIIIIGHGDEVAPVDSMQILENCHVIGSGLNNGLYLYGSRITIRDCYIENVENNYATPQDMMNSSSQQGGHTIDGNTIIYRSGYEIARGGGAGVTYTSTSMTDASKNWVVDYYKDAQAYIGAGDNSVRITGNTSNTISVASWPAGEPADGTSYETDDEHNDGIQFSNFISNTGRWINTVSNNMIIDTRTEGTGWNNMIYNYSDNATVAHEWLIYNNIFYTQKTNSSVGGVAIGGTAVPNFITLKILNNTFIIKGSGGTGSTVVTTWRVDTLIIKNNLVISDSTPNNLYNFDHVEVVHQDIDYNFYAKYGGVGMDAFITQNTYMNFSTWQSAGNDANSATGNSTTISYDDEGSLEATGYYTTTGRDAGIDLSGTYPFLQYDILGNERTGTWDLGALEFQTGSVDTIPTFNFTNISDAELNSRHIGWAVFGGVDSTFHVWSADSFKVGVLSNFDLVMVEADSGDTVFTPISVSNEYSTTVTNTIIAGGISRNFSVTTKAAPPVTTGGLARGSNNNLWTSTNGNFIRFRSPTTPVLPAYIYITTPDGKKWTTPDGNYITIGEQP